MSKVSLQIVQSTERNVCKTLLNRLLSKKSIKDSRAEDGSPADLTYSKDQTLTSLEPSVSLKYCKLQTKPSTERNDLRCKFYRKPNEPNNFCDSGFLVKYDPRCGLVMRRLAGQSMRRRYGTKHPQPHSRTRTHRQVKGKMSGSDGGRRVTQSGALRLPKRHFT